MLRLIRHWLRMRKCRQGHHLYLPCYEVQHWFGKGGRHIRKEFRYQCDACKKHTKWLPLSKLSSFEEKHKPDWSKAYDR
jgi:hypothetical protein